jgi:hypothetical protein
MLRAVFGRAAARRSLGRTGRARRSRRPQARKSGGVLAIDGPPTQKEGALAVSLRAFPLSPPPRFKCTLRYVQDFNHITAAASWLQSFTITANDTFLPITAGGQPLFRDQLFAMYTYSRCVAFSVRVQVIGNSATPAICLVGPIVGGSADTTETTAIERPGTQNCMVTNATNSKMISYSSRVTDYFGTPPVVIWNEAFAQTSAGSLPAGQSCQVQVITSSQKLAAATNVLLRLELLQHVIFETPVQVAAS